MGSATHLACPVCGQERQYRRTTHYLPQGRKTTEEHFVCPDAHDFQHRPPDPTPGLSAVDVHRVLDLIATGRWMDFSDRDQIVAEQLVDWNDEDQRTGARREFQRTYWSVTGEVLSDEEAATLMADDDDAETP